MYYAIDPEHIVSPYQQVEVNSVFDDRKENKTGGDYVYKYKNKMGWVDFSTVSWACNTRITNYTKHPVFILTSDGDYTLVYPEIPRPQGIHPQVVITMEHTSRIAEGDQVHNRIHGSTAEGTQIRIMESTIANHGAYYVSLMHATISFIDPRDANVLAGKHPMFNQGTSTDVADMTRSPVIVVYDPKFKIPALYHTSNMGLVQEVPRSDIMLLTDFFTKYNVTVDAKDVAATESEEFGVFIIANELVMNDTQRDLHVRHFSMRYGLKDIDKVKECRLISANGSAFHYLMGTSIADIKFKSKMHSSNVYYTEQDMDEMTKRVIKIEERKHDLEAEKVELSHEKLKYDHAKLEQDHRSNERREREELREYNTGRMALIANALLKLSNHIFNYKGMANGSNEPKKRNHMHTVADKAAGSIGSNLGKWLASKIPSLLWNLATLFLKINM